MWRRLLCRFRRSSGIRVFSLVIPSLDGKRADYNSGCRAQSSVSGNGHSVYENRTGGARAARERVVSDRRDRAEHVAQVARDGDLLDGIPDLAPFHPVAGGPARVVAGNEIHPEPDQLADEEATTHRPDKAG